MDKQAGRTALFSCSGASNVGELADRACRRVAQTGEAEMFCLSRLGVAEEAVVEGRRRGWTIVVDGCGEACGRKTLQRLGFGHVQHVCVTDLGIEKRAGAGVGEEQVASLAAHLCSLIAAR